MSSRASPGGGGGGLCYGYNVVKRTDDNGEPIRGKRRINEAEAEIVRRIFREFSASVSPRALARRFNNEGIPGPAGALWTDSTLRGPSHARAAASRAEGASSRARVPPVDYGDKLPP